MEKSEREVELLTAFREVARDFRGTHTRFIEVACINSQEETESHPSEAALAPYFSCASTYQERVLVWNDLDDRKLLYTFPMDRVVDKQVDFSFSPGADKEWRKAVLAAQREKEAHDTTFHLQRNLGAFAELRSLPLLDKFTWQSKKYYQALDFMAVIWLNATQLEGTLLGDASIHAREVLQNVSYARRVSEAMT